MWLHCEARPLTFSKRKGSLMLSYQELSLMITFCLFPSQPIVFYSASNSVRELLLRATDANHSSIAGRL